MTFNNVAQWYLILGLITSIIVVFRSFRYRIEQDELSGLASLLFWWVIWIGWGVSKIKKLYDKKQN